MKHLAFFLALLMLLACLAGCAKQQGSIPNASQPAEIPGSSGAGSPTDPEPLFSSKAGSPTDGDPISSSEAVPTPTESVEAPTEEPELLPQDEGVYLQDFTVRTIDGTDFTLSEALADHELVLINLWATWCPPCAMEFPYLQEAWAQSADRVAVIALSIEPDDTEEALRAYAENKGLTFPVGSEAGTGLSSFVTEGIPTTLLVDRSGRVAAVEVGAITSTQDFLELFDGYTGENYDPSVCSYTVCCYDSSSYAEVAGVVLNFCTDTTCSSVTSGADGMAVFSGSPTRYHVQIIRVPDGYQLAGPDEWQTEPYAQIFWIPLERTEP